MRWADLAQGWYFWYSCLWGTTSLGRRIGFSEKTNAPAQARAQHKSFVAMSQKFPSFMAHFLDYSTIYTIVSTHQHTFCSFSLLAGSYFISFTYSGAIMGSWGLSTCAFATICKHARLQCPQNLMDCWRKEKLSSQLSSRTQLIIVQRK